MRNVRRRVPGRDFTHTGTRTIQSVRANLATLVTLTSVLLAGCGQLEPAAPVQPITDPADLYMRLTLNYPAVNLAADATAPNANTVQLVATPYDGTGAPIADAPAPTFRLLGTDTTRLKVTPDGLLQGLQSGNDLKVIAELTIGQVRHVDTAVVNVNAVAPVPVLDTFSIHVPPDSAVWYMVNPETVYPVTSVYAYLAGVAPFLGATAVSPRAVDANGQPIAGLTVNFVSLDSTVAFVNSDGTITAVSPGHARIVARTFAYGVAKADTMLYTVQPPFGSEQFIYKGQFLQPTATIVAGGIMGWISGTAEPADITFDDPTNVTAPPDAFCNFLLATSISAPYCGVGNIDAFVGNAQTFSSPDGSHAWRFRRFQVPGTYQFHSTTTGATGKVIVLEPTPPPTP